MAGIYRLIYWISSRKSWLKFPSESDLRHAICEKVALGEISISFYGKCIRLCTVTTVMEYSLRFQSCRHIIVDGMCDILLTCVQKPCRNRCGKIHLICTESCLPLVTPKNSWRRVHCWWRRVIAACTHLFQRQSRRKVKHPIWTRYELTRDSDVGRDRRDVNLTAYQLAGYRYDKFEICKSPTVELTEVCLGTVPQYLSTDCGIACLAGS